MRLVIGTENEYGLILITPEGRFVDIPEAAEFFLTPIFKFLKQAPVKRSPILRLLSILVEDRHHFWVGATGGKIYNDGVNEGDVLEYASPECDTIEGAVWADKGGELVLDMLRRVVLSEGVVCCDKNGRGEKIDKMVVTKNNSTLIQGQSPLETNFWGSHENYEIREDLLDHYNTLDTDAHKIRFISAFSSLLSCRQLLAGSGGLFRTAGGRWRYVISPRALGIHQVFGRNAAIPNKKPMILYKSGKSYISPSDRFRIQIIVGDSNMMPQALRFRLGLVSLFLRLFEDGDGENINFPIFESPVEALHKFSRDPTLRCRLKLADGRGSWNIVESLQAWLEILMKFVTSRVQEVNHGDCQILMDAHKLTVGASKSPEVLFDKTDWGLKYDLLNKYCLRKRVGFSDPRARRFDVYYADISPQGIYNRWQATQKGDDPFGTEQVDKAIWKHRAAPRAQVRKIFISRLLQKGIKIANLDWGFFPSLGEGLSVFLDDPLLKNLEVRGGLKKLEIGV